MSDKENRWTAIAYYRSEGTPSGLMQVPIVFEEFDELAEFMERGPDWRALERLEVRLTWHTRGEEIITIEEAERQ